ncbi:hypothetical protein F3D3_3867 [Fusibacter sp. 3D3]|nr:hypothetical protein F3D3_3867 [Fusibacter sp. 3D3]
MFDYYMKQYSIDAEKSNGDIIKVFFKEITDANNDDKKFIFSHLGDLTQGEIIIVDGIHWMITQESEPVTHQSYGKMTCVRLIHLINFGIDKILNSNYGAIELGNQGLTGSQYPLQDGKMIVSLPLNENTIKIQTNDRIIKFNSAWKVELSKPQQNIKISFHCI